ncbi:hypothetical protein KUV44_01925 [Marinobacter daepoensis]|uniref:Uncharacterized protein n=1 Tax=Marinobacter daepoensis TaxID=262077 RepID=A0ABS3BBG7_9GAMM|nr:hypothetical protein [Marinobacter daepoensis]MBN7769203.1 hypothetical protein [Marinobacter daepoensis]MBY6077893.1 hypothetical protein [Marinobacter daepoensis]
MRADLLPRTFPSGRFAGLIFLVLAATGCKTEKDPDQPTLLGAPPATAYLGVEYYYNWGAYGGESILDYSLTNAPSWLALEDTSNKARQGIIMRGVPGLSGGARGEADLGQTENIEIVTTDGRMAGFQPFNIEVKRNVIALTGVNLTEGETQEAEDGAEKRCAIPELNAGSYTYDLPLFNADGSPNGTRVVTYPTTRGYVKVELDQPSVTEVKIAFELRTSFDPLVCDNNETDPAHQDCRYSRANTGAVIIGEDIVALSDPQNPPTDREGNPLDYIEYDESNRVISGGLVTFRPGITECYIPFEVVDDLIPEPTEVANVTLTEVRQGIASLGKGGVEVSANVSIDDNEPVLRLETIKGGTRDTINTGTNREYRAVVSGERKNQVRARLVRIGELTGVVETKTFEIGQNEHQGQFIANNELLFPIGPEGTPIDEVPFSVRGLAYTNSPDTLEDSAAPIGVDERFQAGREGYVRGVTETLLRVSLNRLNTPLVWNDGFVATDVAIGHDSRLFVAGYDISANHQVQVRIFDQTGTPLQVVEVTDPALVLQASEVVLDVGVRTVTGAVGNSQVSRYEIAVAFSTESGVLGAAAGGEDAVVSLLHFDGAEYVPSWTDDVFRIGSAGDDIVRWVGISDTTGYVLLGGETQGAWADNLYLGGTDSFLARVDTRPNANLLQPTLAWVKPVGSAADEQVVGGTAEGSLALLFGSSPSTLDGLGNVGPYFFKGNSADGEGLYQIGEDAGEILDHGFYSGSGVVLIGHGPYGYQFRKAQSEDAGTVNADDEIIRTRLNSGAGFVLGFSTAGAPFSAYTVNDDEDVSEEVLTRGVRFAGDIVVAGSTTGRFAGDQIPVTAPEAILARVDTADTELAFRNWRTQLAVENLTLLDLENYRDDELVVLADRNGERMVLIFSPEGELLTPITP